MKVATFNIRYDSIGDKENRWKYRKDKVCQLIKFHEWDVFGLQEVLKHQLDYINDNLSKYDYVGVGREDGINKGEFGPIFYNKNKFELLDSDTFWLSKTPNTPSKSWESACIRICTYAKLLNKKNNKVFIIMNTHFDHVSEEARYESAKLIIDKANEIVNDEGLIILGDFNSTKNEKCYKAISSNFNNTKDISRQAHYGPDGTLNKFKFDISWDELEEIDYIFVNGKVRVIKVGTLTDNIDKKYLSDHFPVMTKVTIK